ncbi:MarR family winged helix-turn-helix transcriptional regulator [Cellulomonas denverensis]|uniref:MarR family transcriptional regulator n=1 Tax=Cellulomonas denverensis TaxID=264297 RepID=A0A7X6QZ51_9CELL|nr:MarR family transcriptional regulator [Cellulomonas denverensis]NKY22706.1 MarR family transcriptional regulator [Cellulomonas denverensis]GIG24646.1 MarR family transcriptional regulator [Cellulomonas denverensis]
MPTDPRWLSPAELRAWTRLEAVAELLPGALDHQLQRDAGLSHYDYLVLAKLSEAPDRTLAMTRLAAATNASLPRLSHVATRLEARGLLHRRRSPGDRRTTLATLTEDGWATVLATAPGHVAQVRRLVIDRLSSEQVEQLDAIALAVLTALDPDGRRAPRCAAVQEAAAPGRS